MSKQEIKQVKPQDLIPYTKNSRTHTDAQIKQVMRSIEEFGFTNPILLHKNTILAGHCRVEAAKRLGIKTVPCLSLDHLTPDQARAYVIADNKLAMNAGWDDDVLKQEIEDLLKADFDISLIGFDTSEFKDLGVESFAPEFNSDPDDVPEVPQNVHGVERGQVWQLGEHRLMCGDSINESDVSHLMDGQKTDMVFTDPPYGMNLNTKYAISPRVFGKTYAKVLNDDKDFDPSFILNKFGYCDEIFLWGADYYCRSIPKGGSWIVWDKKKEELDESIGTGYELCWSKQPHKRMLARFLWSGFTAKEKRELRIHPTQKPIDLCIWFFDRWGKETNKVVDLFGGSGSTLIACEKTGRKCYMMELDEHYCSVIIERWQQFTGKKAEKIA